MMTKEAFEKELQEVRSRKFAYIECMTKLRKKRLKNMFKRSGNRSCYIKR